MEDFIYLIILIAWVVFAFYRQSQKKKAASAPSPKPEHRSAEGGMKTLEEILFGEDSASSDPLPTKGPVEERQWQRIERERERERAIPLEEMYMKPQIESLEKTVADNRKKVLEPIQKEEVEEDENNSLEIEETLRDFNLKKAVIYAEILKRPYD